MPHDMQLGRNRDIELDNGGDILLASGKQLLEQSVYLSVANETQISLGEKLTASTVRLLQERIREALDDDEYLGDVLDVTILSYNQVTGEVKITADVLNGDTIKLVI